MDNFSEAAIYQHQATTVKIAQFLRGTVVVLLLGGVMYAAALIAHRQTSVTPAAAAPVSAQQ
jgi:hypothetical protein